MKQRQRDRESVTSPSVTYCSVTLLERPNGEPYNPDELLMADGTRRYVGPFSDGQVLDRKTVPLPNKELPRPKFTPVGNRELLEASR